MDSSVSPKDDIWFLRVCHHISNAVYWRIRSRICAYEAYSFIDFAYTEFTVRHLPDGHAMAQAFHYASRRHSKVGWIEICGAGTDCSPSTSVSPCRYHSTISHRRYTILATDSVVEQHTKNSYFNRHEEEKLYTKFQNWFLKYAVSVYKVIWCRTKSKDHGWSAVKDRKEAVVVHLSLMTELTSREVFLLQLHQIGGISWQ